MNNYCAFDLEIYKSIPEGETDWKRHRPLGISCAATLLSGQEEPMLWWGTDYGPMTVAECQALVAYLQRKQASGTTIISWNGLGFDFENLSIESGLHAECADLALNHIDLMFQFFAIKGFPLGLDACAKGCGLPGKTEGMDGAKAPELWQAGEYAKVLEYVGQDVKTTIDIAETVERQKGFDWTAKSGRRNSVRINKWLTVAECLALPEPDNSWMSEPMQRSTFAGWLS